MLQCLPNTATGAVLWMLVLSIPWAACLRALRCGEIPAEARDTAVLLAMVGLPALGIICLVAALLVPVTVSLSSAIPALQDGLVAARHGDPAVPGATGTDDILHLAGRAALFAYSAGVLWRLTRIGIMLRRLSRLSASAHAASILGVDIGLHDEPWLPPLAVFGHRVLLSLSLVEMLAPDRLRLVIAHERAHLERRDPVRFLGLALVDAVFWANPFVLRQTDTCRLAAELDCDGRVLTIHPRMRRTYAETLVEVLRKSARAAPACAPAVFSHRTKGDHSMRLTCIMAGAPARRKPLRMRLLGGLLGIGLPLAALQGAVALGVVVPELSVRPVDGILTSAYGARVSPITGRDQNHHGVDIKARAGTPVLAPGRGVVVSALEEGRYGNVLVIDHGEGYVTRYAHLEGFEVASGDRVRAGQRVARVGSSGASNGPHLHLELYIDDVRVDPATVLDVPPRRD